MNTQLTKIEGKISCSHCDFSTSNGLEMHDHLFHDHVMYWSGMQYAMCWKIGQLNTYDWMVKNAQELETKYLPKCSICGTPRIVYEGQNTDTCDKCILENPRARNYSKNQARLQVLEGKVV